MRLNVLVLFVCELSCGVVGLLFVVVVVCDLVRVVLLCVVCGTMSGVVWFVLLFFECVCVGMGGCVSLMSLCVCLWYNV